MPSEGLVIPRFGYSPRPDFGMQEDLALIAAAVAALKGPRSGPPRALGRRKAVHTLPTKASRMINHRSIGALIASMIVSSAATGGVILHELLISLLIVVTSPMTAVPLMRAAIARSRT